LNAIVRMELNGIKWIFCNCIVWNIMIINEILLHFNIIPFRKMEQNAHCYWLKVSCLAWISMASCTSKWYWAESSFHTTTLMEFNVLEGNRIMEWKYKMGFNVMELYWWSSIELLWNEVPCFKKRHAIAKLYLGGWN